MIADLWLIGIGTGNPDHVTAEGLRALREAAVVLLPRKGAAKDELAELRLEILRASGSTTRIVPFDYPTRDPALPYRERVEAWHDEIARRWQAALDGEAPDGPVALLVWGDPSLYDSTIRIARRLDPAPRIRVVPGITAIQALTAAHAIPLNEINGPVLVTTGRRLAEEGWPEGADTIVVMLDGEARFRDLAPAGVEIWWGAYLGSRDQILAQGPLAGTAEEIARLRAEARARHGWIMDTYLLRRPARTTQKS